MTSKISDATKSKLLQYHMMGTTVPMKSHSKGNVLTYLFVIFGIIGFLYYCYH